MSGPTTQEEIEGLRQELSYYRHLAAYLLDATAATLETWPKKASRGERARLAVLCDNGAEILLGTVKGKELLHQKMLRYSQFTPTTQEAYKQAVAERAIKAATKYGTVT